MDLKTEAQYRQELATCWQLIEQAQAAMPALRKDAERYRWLRDRCPWTMCSAHAVTRLALRLPIGYECHAEDKHDMDAAIDAAMTKETP